MFPVGQQQPAYLPAQRPGLFPVRQLRHEEHVGGTLHDSEDSVVVAVYYQLHLEVPKPFSICLFGALMDTGPAGNGRSLAFGAAPVFELMARMACQFPGRIGMYDIVDALMRHADALIFQNT